MSIWCMEQSMGVWRESELGGRDLTLHIKCKRRAKRSRPREETVRRFMARRGFPLVCGRDRGLVEAEWNEAG